MDAAGLMKVPQRSLKGLRLLSVPIARYMVGDLHPTRNRPPMFQQRYRNRLPNLLPLRGQPRALVRPDTCSLGKQNLAGHHQVTLVSLTWRNVLDLNNDTQSFSQNEAAEVSDCGSFAETLQTISTPGRSPATPSLNPSTPKAMILNTNDLEVGPSFSGSLNGSEKTPTPRCAEVAAQSTSSMSPSSVV
ncbi:unnamed protein product [Fusarium langsethiae]|nr:unnamed protein product [Fusarium langsethiae]